MVRIGPFEFTRCPVIYLDPELQTYVHEHFAVRSGRAQAPSFAERARMTARRVAALDLLALLEVKRGNHD